MKNLQEISDKDLLEVAKIAWSNTYLKDGYVDRTNGLTVISSEGSMMFRDVNSISDITDFVMIYHNGIRQDLYQGSVIRIVDYLRQFYHIPNAYAPVGSAEEVLREVYGLGHRGTYTKQQVIAAMQSYASQPIGKGAEERDEEWRTLVINKMTFMSINNRAEFIKQIGDTFYGEATPTTDWDKVTAEQCADDLEISLIDVRSVFEYLKQHIGAGESNTAYNDRIDTLVAEDWQQRLHEYIAEELNVIPLNDQLADIRDIILPKRYPYTLTAPASEQVDENDLRIILRELTTGTRTTESALRKIMDSLTRKNK